MSIFSQENVEPYTAKAFWLEINKENYRTQKQKVLNGDTLSNDQKIWLSQYEEYLNSYFNTMPGDERQKYYAIKDSLYNQSGYNELISFTPETSQEQDNELLLKNIGYSGLAGWYYGFYLDAIFDIDGGAAMGVPLILAGGGTLIPLISKKYDDINNNALWLRWHGKVVGGFHGLMLGMTIFGDESFADYDKATLTLSMASSIIGGNIGFKVGKNKPLTEGQASLLQYYGYVFPITTASILFTANADNVRAYSIPILLSAPLGYYSAYKLGQKVPYTRGDVASIFNATALGTLYGTTLLLAMDPEDPSAILTVTIGGLLGSSLGHLYHVNNHVSRPQGRRLNYATWAGAIMGLGVAAVFDTGEPSVYTLMASVSGTISYVALLKYYQNNPESNYSDKGLPANMNFSLHPESLLVNRMKNVSYVPPLASFSMKF